MPRKSKSARSSAGSKGKDKGHPDDIVPMLLTSATQELFGCRADEDVTGESPYKLLKKDDIIQDFKTRAAVSDFRPVKQIVLDYPEDELLLVFDKDFIYGQRFYLVVTPEAKERILNVVQPPEPETPEVIETPEPSLSSEQEIDEESVKETREKLCYKFSRVRRKFGAPVVFSDSITTLVNCPSYPDSKFSIKLMQRDCGSQAAARLRSSSAQTQWMMLRNMSTQYTPRELSSEEKEKILQSDSMKNFCKLVTPRMLQALQEESIMNVFFDDWKALGTAVEDIVWSGEDFKDLRFYRGFSDQNYTKDKKISSINWHPTIYGVIAVALTEKRQEQEPTTFASKDSLILFYSFSDIYNAQLLLECPGDIFAFEFCPSDPNIIVGGCKNGQVVLWDISAYVTHLQGTQPDEEVSVNTEIYYINEERENKPPVVPFCAVSFIDSSHKAAITDVHWLPPTFEVTKTGLPVENKYNISAQIVTCSPDCALMFWDVRVPDRKQNVYQKTPYGVPNTFKHLYRTWKPLFRVSLPKIDTSGEYAPLKFSLERSTCTANTARTTEAANENDDSSKVIPDYSQLRVPSAKTLTTLEDVNTKLFIGTESGEIIYTDWKLVKDESGRLHTAKPLHCFSIHHWLVNTVQLSPFFTDIVLTIGSWSFAIWNEGVMDGPIIKSPNFEHWCTVGCWSLSRPAIFFIGKENGSIEVWNLLENTNVPAQVLAQVTDAKITCIKPWIASSKQHFLAVTDELGMLKVFELPKALCVPSWNESLRVLKVFEVQEERLKDLVRCRELWAKEQKEAEELKKRTEHDVLLKPLREEEEHKMLEESIMKGLGLWPATADKQDA
ncbi:dynein axonemal intermediate chain 3 [Cebidichthys violaceus]|uniref:dynein axonemal intermediate chain 3 n=1 Tax=Cebidichthys violaceus TaxID=271503 RepID=UPI0035C95D91